MAGTNIKIHVYDEFKEDLKNSSNTLNLFYYYLSTSKHSNEINDSYHGKTDDEVSSSYEPRVKDYPYYLHILSTDIIDDFILVSKLVDPNINLANAKYIHVMYRVNIIENEEVKYIYKSAYTVEVPPFNSEITKNDYNYLYLDLTEFGSILADIRLNNTYPIYETSHVVKGDSEYIGSAILSDSVHPIQSPKSNIDRAKELDIKDIQDAPSLSFSTENFTRQYTEEFYHMGDFTIRLLGRNLDSVKIHKDRYTRGSDIITDSMNNDTGLNLMHVINPDDPKSRSLNFINNADFNKLFEPRMNQYDQGILYLPNVADTGSVLKDKCVKLLEVWHDSQTWWHSFEFDINRGKSRCKVFFSVNPNENEKIFIDKSYAIGSIGDSEYLYVQVDGNNHVKVWYKLSSGVNGSDLSVQNFGSYNGLSSNSNNKLHVKWISESPEDWVENEDYFTISTIPSGFIQIQPTSTFAGLDRDNILKGLKSVSSFDDTEINASRYGENAIDLNDGNAHYLSVLDFDTNNVNSKVIKRCIQKIEIPRVWNNCVGMKNGSDTVNFPSGGSKVFDQYSSILIRHIDANVDRILTHSKLLNVLMNDSGWHQVSIDNNLKLMMPPYSKFTYRAGNGGALYWGGFIDNGICKCDSENPSMSDAYTQYYYRYGLDEINYSITTSGNCTLQSNINKVHYIINNSENAGVAKISSYQCRYVRYNNAMYGALLTSSSGYSSSEYRSCNWDGVDGGSEINTVTETIGDETINVGVMFDLYPHSLTVYSNSYVNATLYHKILYRIPIYY